MHLESTPRLAYDLERRDQRHHYSLFVLRPIPAAGEVACASRRCSAHMPPMRTVGGYPSTLTTPLVPRNNAFTAATQNQEDTRRSLPALTSAGNQVGAPNSDQKTPPHSAEGHTI